MNKKQVFGALFLVVVTLFVGSASVHAFTPPSFFYAKDMTVGSTGEDVVNLQEWLIVHNFNIPAISSGAAAKGYFGSQTQNAVRMLQRAVGIPDLGVVGPLTRRYLNSGETSGMRVLYPDGGLHLQMGKVESIRWKTGSVSEVPNVSIYVHGNHCVGVSVCTASMDPIYTIANNISNSGEFAWNVGSYLNVEYGGGPMLSGRYRVYVCKGTQSFFTPSACVSSVGWVEISGAQPNIEITSPRDGETWVASTTRYIIWTMAAGSSLTHVDMYLDAVQSCLKTLKMEGGIETYCPPATQKYVLDRNLPAKQTYGWIVATDIVNNPIADGRYVIRLCPAGKTDSCVSGKEFNISAYPVIQSSPQ